MVLQTAIAQRESIIVYLVVVNLAYTEYTIDVVLVASRSRFEAGRLRRMYPALNKRSCVEG
jgi:hypothetical protein